MDVEKNIEKYFEENYVFPSSCDPDYELEAKVIQYMLEERKPPSLKQICVNLNVPQEESKHVENILFHLLIKDLLNDSKRPIKSKKGRAVRYYSVYHIDDENKLRDHLEKLQARLS
jgi:predicted transcriptional regulator